MKARPFEKFELPSWEPCSWWRGIAIASPRLWLTIVAVIGEVEEEISPPQSHIASSIGSNDAGDDQSSDTSENWSNSDDYSWSSHESNLLDTIPRAHPHPEYVRLEIDRSGQLPLKLQVIVKRVTDRPRAEQLIRANLSRCDALGIRILDSSIDPGMIELDGSVGPYQHLRFLAIKYKGIVHFKPYTPDLSPAKYLCDLWVELEQAQFITPILPFSSKLRRLYINSKVAIQEMVVALNSSPQLNTLGWFKISSHHNDDLITLKLLPNLLHLSIQGPTTVELLRDIHSKYSPPSSISLGGIFCRSNRESKDQVLPHLHSFAIPGLWMLETAIRFCQTYSKQLEHVDIRW